jgi:hypothetical protein
MKKQMMCLIASQDEAFKVYEEQKKELNKLNLSPEEYEAKIKELAKELEL